MADRFWRGGTANWDGTAGTKWAATVGGAGGAGVPTSADDVFFDAASGAVTCTISGGNTGAKSINCTGFTGTLTGSVDITVSGNITFVAGMTLSVTNTITVDGTATLISDGKSYANLTVSGAGITVTLGDALSVLLSCIISSGTFTTNNYNVTTLSLSSNNSNVRAINLGSSILTLGGSSPISFTTSTNLTFNAGTSQINVTLSTASFNGGGLTFYNVNFTSIIASVRTMSGANTFNNLILNASATGLSVLNLTANQVINGTFTCSGSSAIARGQVRSSVTGTVRTLTVGTLSATDCDFRDITVAGAAAGTSPTRAGDCGGNSGITFPAAKNVYWNLAGTQDWNANAWASTSGGAPTVNNFPLAQDTAIFDDAGAAGTVNFGTIQYSISGINASSRTSAMTLNQSSQQIYGSITLGSGVTVTGTGISTLLGRGTTNISTAGKTITFGLSINTITGTVRLLEAYNASASITIASGIFNANNYSVTITGFGSSGTLLAKTVTMGSGLWTMTSPGTAWNLGGSLLTLNKDTANILFSADTTFIRVFNGLGLTYNKLTIGGATLTGTTQFSGNNTFSELASTKPVAHTLSFAAGSTTTVGAWTITGTAGNVVTIITTTTGTHNLVKTGGGVIATDYMSITDSAATPANTWFAGSNSTNVSGNSGWIFGGTSYSSSISESSTITDVVIGALQWNLIDDSQTPNWQNINNI
jgi:hypothetical protein